MRPFLRLLVVAICSLLAAPGVAAAAQQGVPLASVARAANLQYAWLGAERAVQLSGPGLIVVIRPGEPIYDVNDRVEVAAITPHYAANDIYVSPATAATHRTARRAGVDRLLQRAGDARAPGDGGRKRRHGRGGDAGEHHPPRSTAQRRGSAARNGRGAARRRPFGSPCWERSLRISPTSCLAETTSRRARRGRSKQSCRSLRITFATASSTCWRRRYRA